MQGKPEFYEALINLAPLLLLTYFFSLRGFDALRDFVREEERVPTVGWQPFRRVFLLSAKLNLMVAPPSAVLGVCAVVGSALNVLYTGRATAKNDALILFGGLLFLAPMLLHFSVLALTAIKRSEELARLARDLESPDEPARGGGGSGGTAT